MDDTSNEIPLFDRDLSWLSFNARVLDEARRDQVPLLERIKFLSIYSSNLDEFYRVRMPVLLALAKLSKKENNDISFDEHLLEKVNDTIRNQQQQYGSILKDKIKPSLLDEDINFIYGEEVPVGLHQEVCDYFLNHVLGFLNPINLRTGQNCFFPVNNQLYFIVSIVKNDIHDDIILNIPTDHLPRFFKIVGEKQTFILFLDDIISHNFKLLFKDAEVVSYFSFKVTRTAEIDLKDEYEGDIAAQIEKQLQKRDLGLATRFLYQPGIPLTIFTLLINKFNLQKANLVAGGQYHNLKDLADFPLVIPKLLNDTWPQINYPLLQSNISLFDEIKQADILINPPYQSYHSILRFFNEASNDEDVNEILITLYRVASDSKIVNALITAAKNGKKVTVLVELKARFDEANNIKWAKKMKEAGVEIIYSVTALKVHAKIALVKRKIGLRISYAGLFATGNFNETTANFYTDHILMTSHQEMLREMELLFIFLAKRQKPSIQNQINFKYLLVAQFNLLDRFLALIQREIQFAKSGLPANIVIKLNNLEEKRLITKLYEASKEGVKINLIIRGICRLIPGVKGMSENISIIRIVDRYLEHGRIFLFHNNGDEELFLGSADWMNRNIYRRVEVCFPVLDQKNKDEIKSILALSLKDNTQSVILNREMQNIPVEINNKPLQSQYRIYKLLKNK